MLYSNCKQITGHRRRRTSMQDLRSGSVICFGSTVDGDFCVDTVLVVASAEPWVPSQSDDLLVDDAFKTCTGESLTTAPRDRHLRLTLYRGATPDNPIDDMFSFIPAQRADEGDPRFARRAIRLPGKINAASKQSTWGSKRHLRISEVRDAWSAVRQQVLDHDLLLAVAIDTPNEMDSGELPESARESC